MAWMENIGVWFEIPVVDIERAKKFYSAVFGVKFNDMVHNNCKVAMFPFERGVVSGTLVEYPDNKPSTTGTTVYLNGGKDLSETLSKVVKAGGEILLDRTSIKEYGFMAYFKDSEGNKIGLQSMMCDGQKAE